MMNKRECNIVNLSIQSTKIHYLGGRANGFDRNY